MESKPNYTLIGIFVVLLGTAFVGVTFWLYAGGIYKKRYDRYYAYFEESVAGLSVNAPVRFKGVDVGRVLELGLAPDRAGQVRLLLNIEQDTPIKEDTVATLRMQGLTGLVQVELSGGSAKAASLKAPPESDYPVIRTKPSLMTRLDTSVTTALATLSQTAENINHLLDADMRRDIKRSLASLALASAAVAEAAPQLGAVAKHTELATVEIAKLAKRLGQTASAVERAAEDISKTSGAARAVIDDARGGLGQIGNQTVPEINALVGEMRDVAASLKRVGAELERNPSALVFGRPAASPGPGE